jgi:Tfp pilus assembly protein PilE
MFIVVVIMTTLGLAAIRVYHRYLDQARTAEAAAVLAEIRTREEAYRAEFSSYLSTSTSESDA